MLAIEGMLFMIKKLYGIYSQFLRSQFIRHVFILSGASVFAQMINIAIMPLLSRLYSPQDFGVLSLFSSIVGLLAIVSGFKYCYVLPLARQNRYVHAIIFLSFSLQIAFVLFLGMLTLVLGECLNGTRYKMLYPYRYLIPICVLAIGLYSMSVQWAIREKNFSLIARTKLTQTVAGNIVKISGAIMWHGPLGLLLGHVIGQSCGGFALIKNIIKREGRPHFDYIRMKRAALVYRNMFLIDTPGDLLNMAGAYILPFVIAYYYSDRIVGSFSMAQNLLVLPGVIVGRAIGQVFAQKSAEARYNGTLGNITGKTFELLARLGLFPVLLFSLFAPEIFRIALGEKWLEAGYFASILGPWLAVNFIYSPMSILFTTLMIQRTAFVFTSIYTITRLGSIAIFSKSSPIYAILALSISGTIMMIIGVILLLVQSNVMNIRTRLCRVFGEALISLIPVIVFLFLCRDGIILCIIAIMCSLLLYFAFLFAAYKSDKLKSRKIY